MRRYAVTVTTDASGDAVAYTPRLAGKVHSIRYAKAGTNSYTDGVDFTITNEATGETIWAQNNVNASATVSPRQATHGTDGTASLFAAGGTAVQTPVPVGNDRIKIVVAQGGNAKNGTFHVFIDR